MGVTPSEAVRKCSAYTKENASQHAPKLYLEQKHQRLDTGGEGAHMDHSEESVEVLIVDLGRRTRTGASVSREITAGTGEQSKQWTTASDK